MVALEEKSGIFQIMKILPLGNVSACTELNNSLSNICWGVSDENKEVDQTTDSTVVPRATSLA